MKNYVFKHKVIFILSTLLLCIYSVGQVGVAYIVKAITDAVSKQNLHQLYKVFLIAVVYLFFVTIIEILAKITKAKFIKLAMSSLRTDIFNRLFKLDISSFNMKNSADYISLLNNDVKLVEESYFQNLMELISSVVQLIVAIIALCLINPILAIATISVNFIPMVIPLIFGKKLSKLKDVYSEQLSIYTEKLKDFCIGFEVIKSFNIEKEVSKSHETSNIKVENKKYILSSLEGISYSLSNFGALLIFISIFICGGYFVINSSLEFGTMLAVVQLLNYVVGPIVNISEKVGKFKSVKGIERKLNEILNIKEKTKGEIKITSFKESIAIESLSFSYDGEKKVIDNVNMIFERGKKYAIVGGSGSGKSTLLKLLLRYYDDYEGKITMDGIDIQEISIDQIYQMVSIIHQNVFMFDDTIFNNVALYKQYTMEQVLNSIKNQG